MKLNFWIGIGVSVILVVTLVSSIDVSRTVQALAQADYLWLAPAVLILALSFLLRAIRWQALFAAVQPVAFRSILSATMIGFMGNMILPARLGELIRAYLIGRKEAVSGSTALATIVLERLCDGFAILLVWFVLMFFVDLPPAFKQWEAYGRYFALSSGALYCLILAFCILLKHKSAAFLNATQGLRRRLPRRWGEKLGDSIGRFAIGLQAIRASRQLLTIVFWSLLVWVVVSLINYPVIRSFHAEVPVSAVFLVMVFQAFAVMLPSSPGFIGTFHLGTMTALQVYGLSKEVSLSIAIVMHLATFAFIVAVGMYFLWTENLTLRSLSRLTTEPKPQSPNTSHETVTPAPAPPENL